MPFGKSKAPIVDPDEWYGKSLGETFGNRHFQLQLVAMMGLHAALYYYFKGNPKQTVGLERPARGCMGGGSRAR